MSEKQGLNGGKICFKSVSKDAKKGLKQVTKSSNAMHSYILTSLLICN